jgi:hypothetical protein
MSDPSLDPRQARWYGILNLAFAALYAWVGFSVAPSRSRLFNVALAVVIGGLGLAGAGLLARLRWARALAIGACALLLAFAAAVVAGLVASSAYLSGVFGPIGRGMALLCWVAAALVVEGLALLPFFELRFLLAGRGASGRAGE